MTILSAVAIDPEYRSRPWYFDIPAIGQLLDHRLELTPATVIVGENGSGKSTLIEAIAGCWRGRALTGAEVRHWSAPVSAEDTDLQWHLELTREFPSPQGGCFLRAEAMHGLFTGLDADGLAERAFGGPLNAQSHGESFLAYLDSRMTERGLFLLDEPEAALSFTSCLRLLSMLDQLVRSGSQVIMATHSPVLASLPGATVLEFGPDGMVPTPWEDLDLVQHWRAFLDSPELYLRYLFDDSADDTDD